MLDHFFYFSRFFKALKWLYTLDKHPLDSYCEISRHRLLELFISVNVK